MSLKNLSVKNKIPKLLENKLKDNKIVSIYNNFHKSLNLNKNFIVAVSGGPDSLALAFLAKIYSIKKNLKSRFLIIDHKLREGSSEEAKIVKKVLRKYSIKAEILTWKGKKPTKNIQSEARKIRYELLISKCNQLKIENILIGHHQDDLFENFFIRILRGSGLKGLISLDKRTKLENINLLRPLLDQKKDDLIFISKHVFNFFVKDPFNYNEKFKRIKVRKLINELQNDGLDKKKFSETIKNLKSSDYAINFYVLKNLEENSFFLKKKNQFILNEEFFNQPHEVIFRSLSNIIKNIGKKYYFPRGKKIDKLLYEMRNERSFKATLGGCLLERVKKSVIVKKEQ